MSETDGALPLSQTDAAYRSQVAGRDRLPDQGTLPSRQGQPPHLVVERPAEHALREPRDSFIDELAIAVDPPASASAADRGTNKRDFVSWMCRGFGGLYFLFYAVALVGALPRGLVLLASRALPQAPPSQAVTGFLDFWQSCADPANLYSDFSPRGIVYKVLVGSDILLTGLGISMACVAALYLIFPDASQSRRGAWRLGMTAAVCFLVRASHFAVELSTLMNDHVSLGELLGLHTLRETFALVTLAAAYVGCVCVAMGFSANGWRCFVAQNCLEVTWGKLCVLAALAGTAAVTWQISTILWFFADTFAGKVDAVLAASALCRGLNFLVRGLITQDGSLPVHAVNVVSMILLSFTSVAIRRIILAQSIQNPLVLLVSCLKLASLELLGRSISYAAMIMMIGWKMQGLNTLTLGGLADVHTRVQHDVDGLTTYMLVDQFIEVFVFVMITTQELTAPIWSLFRVWLSVEAYSSRGPYILLEGVIQMGVEFCVDYLVWRACFHRLAWDLPHIIRRVVFKKPVAVFTMSMMLMHSLNFFPFCMECSRPVSCLVFTECLFDGKVMMDGINACTAVPKKDRKYAEFAVQEMLSRTQVKVSAEQLGCGRQGVDCYGLAGGANQGCFDWSC